MRLLTGLGVLLFVVACDAAIVRRNKRQLGKSSHMVHSQTSSSQVISVPLAASCDMYATCAPPATDVAGLNVWNSPTLPSATTATPVHYPAQMYQPPQPAYPAPHPAVPQPPPQPQGYYPPYQQPSQPSPQPEHPPVTYPVTDGYVSPSEPTTTTTQPRMCAFADAVKNPSMDSAKELRSVPHGCQQYEMPEQCRLPTRIFLPWRHLSITATQ
ncbi:hypothetical protein TELCIR_12583 [Teladorsagia circumcincta]|uniref:Uncharacterized protein n=1 Tax=Teladorsagia circumcincta TaxID=45464 RepID=A0A2G9U636_TELCI|nr:hypothetical protein TELCIR_12583 [Teladorsagia circumcincta]